MAGIPLEGIKQSSEPQTLYNPSPTADQYFGFGASEVASTSQCLKILWFFEVRLINCVLQDFNKDGIQRTAYNGVLPGPSEPSDIVAGPSYTSSGHPLVVCNLHFHWFYALCNMILAMIILDQ